ncbi:Smr/MutS family protein [Chitinimonas sp. BJB300]|uniref:Smr/MutS family protein n=1 Tax=Chitinimonas sp. BJB300 TaxID=1559339 RepID=UPI000C0FC430|nr:Smr/MutS family protein [Chitinimonas sp. BJB300]PHV13133.1 DNA mismatch repair protein MutS [Chitinimonas sp. BJB300]TSJ84730.1 DNA mismatch repair protein MutS [Chitinimonas sp. BJB300]
MSRRKTLLADQLQPLAHRLRRQPRRHAQATPPTQEDDASLLRRALAGVEPLRHPLPYLHPHHPIPPWPLQHPLDEHDVIHDAMSDFWPWDEIDSNEALLYMRPGQRLDTLKKLRKAHWPVQGQLDLHSMNSDQARTAVSSFLHGSVIKGKRCIRIVHGKGLSSKNREPVLKNKLRNWLIQRDEVLAFCQAPVCDGGTGAVLVLLRSARSN